MPTTANTPERPAYSAISRVSESQSPPGVLPPRLHALAWTPKFMMLVSARAVTQTSRWNQNMIEAMRLPVSAGLTTVRTHPAAMSPSDFQQNRLVNHLVGLPLSSGLRRITPFWISSIERSVLAPLGYCTYAPCFISAHPCLTRG